ncbi:MAG: T9SS type B sorting domain-containing protein [Bacteroidetes bacterium]|nr:T9SS type B sorting domain-containing protein [Bacteroidota bacterium]
MNFPDPDLVPGEYIITIDDPTSEICCQITTGTNVNNVVGGVCNGSIELTPTGGSEPYSYLWGNGAMTSTITDLCVGDYIVTITDQLGCSDTLNFTIIEPPTCEPDTTIYNGDPGVYPLPYDSIESPNGGIDLSACLDQYYEFPFTVLNTDTFNFQGFDVVLDTFELTGLTGLPEGLDYVCNPPDCSITYGEAGCLLIYGTPTTNNASGDYLLQISGSAVTSFGVFNLSFPDPNLIPGEYAITIEDPGSDICCMLEFDTTLINASCAGACDGSISITASNGSDPYSFIWNNGNTTSSLTDLCAGNYSLTVTDQLGCSETLVFTITDSPPLNVGVINQTDLTCPDDNNGSLTISVVGGTPAYSFDWESGQVDSVLTNLMVGDYIVTITDQNDCTVIDTFSIGAPPVLEAVLLNQSDPLCNGDTTGMLMISATGGTPAYSYVWNTGTSDTLLNNLEADTYLLTITDQNNCEVIASYTLSEPMPLSILPDMIENVQCDGTPGSILLDVTGGSPDYSYVWSNGSNDASIQGLATDTYLITVTDANNCVDSASYTITSNELAVEVSTIRPDCFGDTNGEITVSNVTGGSGVFLYGLENNPLQSSPIFNNLESGLYSIVIQDDSGCEVTEVITVPATPEFVASLGEDFTLSLGDSIQLDIVSNNPFSKIEWTPDESLSCIDCPDPFARPIITTNYSVMVTDTSGCLTSTTLVVFVDKSRNVFIPNIFSPNGDGFNDFFMINAGPEVEKVDILEIYSRWGEKLFSASNFPPNDFAISWDGKFKGKELPSAVYVYYAEISFIDGKKEVFEGDITLLRNP